jgi:hypothetical protein
MRMARIEAVSRLEVSHLGDIAQTGLSISNLDSSVLNVKVQMAPKSHESMP